MSNKTPLDRVLEFLFQWDKGDLIAQADHRSLTYADLTQIVELAKSVEVATAARAEQIARAIEARQEEEKGDTDSSIAADFFARGESYGYSIAARICRGLDPVPSELPPGALTLKQARSPW